MFYYSRNSSETFRFAKLNQEIVDRQKISYQTRKPREYPKNAAVR